MLSFDTLSIQGYEGRPVPHTFVRQGHATDHLAILYPGQGYRATMPVLFYPERLLATGGADVLRVEYAYDQQPAFNALPVDERVRWFASDVTAACEAGLAQRAYSRVTLVGKSIGTRALGHLLATQPAVHAASYVWLTPLLRDAHLRDRIRQAKPRSLFVIGTADGQFDPALLAEMEQATGGQSLVIEDADHSLEIEGDLRKSLRAIESLLQALARFCDIAF